VRNIQHEIGHSLEEVFREATMIVEHRIRSIIRSKVEVIIHETIMRACHEPHHNGGGGVWDDSGCSILFIFFAVYCMVTEEVREEGREQHTIREIIRRIIRRDKRR
jgi:hypothetical protein